MAEPKTLDEALERYKSGKAGLGRQDLFTFVVNEITQLKSRLDEIDAAQVDDLTTRVAALETVIGRALQAQQTSPTAVNMATSLAPMKLKQTGRK